MRTRVQTRHPALRRLSSAATLAASAALGAGPVGAEDNLVASVQNGCKQELAAYCSKVTPGRQRALACLSAHEDWLSGRCEYALYDAAAQLQRALSAISYVANECKIDLEKHCSTIEPGGGRLAACIKRNESVLTPRGSQAMKDAELEVVQ